MRAIRVKLDGELLHAIGSIKPRNQPLAAYVREALRRDIERQQIRQAAGIYRKLMRDNPAEKKALEEWESAPLAITPGARRKRNVGTISQTKLP